MGNLFRDEILDEAGAGENRGAEGPCKRAHVRTVAPTIVWGRQFQTNFVFKDVGQRIDFDVQCTPQRGSHRCVVWRRHLLITHDAFALCT